VPDVTTRLSFYAHAVRRRPAARSWARCAGRSISASPEASPEARPARAESHASPKKQKKRLLAADRRRAAPRGRGGRSRSRWPSRRPGGRALSTYTPAADSCSSDGLKPTHGRVPYTWHFSPIEMNARSTPGPIDTATVDDTRSGSRAGHARLGSRPRQMNGQDRPPYTAR